MTNRYEARGHIIGYLVMDSALSDCYGDICPIIPSEKDPSLSFKWWSLYLFLPLLCFLFTPCSHSVIFTSLIVSHLYGIPKINYSLLSSSVAFELNH